MDIFRGHYVVYRRLITRASTSSPGLAWTLVAGHTLAHLEVCRKAILPERSSSHSCQGSSKSDNRGGCCAVSTCVP